MRRNVSDTCGVCGMGASVARVCAPFVDASGIGVVGVIVVVTGRVVESAAGAAARGGTSCTVDAVRTGGSGGYSGADIESTSTLV